MSETNVGSRTLREVSNSREDLWEGVACAGQKERSGMSREKAMWRRNHCVLADTRSFDHSGRLTYSRMLLV